MPSQIGDDAEKRTASAIDYLRHALDMLESRLNGDDANSTDRVMLAYARQDLVALEAEIAMLRGTMTGGSIGSGSALMPSQTSKPELRADQELLLEEIADRLMYAEAEALQAALAEIDRQRTRIVALEAEIAMLRGTLEKPTTDEPTTYADNLPPNAPPHDE